MLENCDADFLADLEACLIPNSRFGHREHLRAAWAYIRCYGLATGATKMEATIARFASHHGHPQKYHRTMTAAWLHLVAVHAVQHPASTFDEFINKQRRLLDKRLIECFYSRAVLFSDDARRGWIEPDLQPFPAIA